MELTANIQSLQRNLQARILRDIRRYPWSEPVAIFLASALVFGLGLQFSIKIFLHDNLSVCWPLVGLQAAALLRIPRRHWPPVLAGIIVSQLILESWATRSQMAADTLCDLAEVLVAAFCLPALDGLSHWMQRPHLLRRFIVGPMILGPALTAFPVALVFSHILHKSYWSQWIRWFAGDMLGIVLWLPLGIVLMSPETYALFRWKALPRTVGLIGLLSIAGWCIFHFRPTSIAFTLMPLLLLIALKLGFSGSVIAVNVLSIVSAEGTLHHLGPFGALPEPFSVVTLQVYLTVSMLICFPISILMLERDHFEQEILEAFGNMKKLATSDGLTGLANRRRFDTVFEQEWRRAIRSGQPVAVMMIDVDCFKLFNDHYGHLAGDECLRQVATAIGTSIKRAGDLAARYGGEEFVVLMPHSDLAGARKFAEIIRAQVERLGLEHLRSPHNIVTISIGCWSAVPKAGVARETLIECADQGLYAAKQGGRNRVGTLLPGAPRAEDVLQAVSRAS